MGRTVTNSNNSHRAHFVPPRRFVTEPHRRIHTVESRTMRALVVDDSRPIRRIEKDMLTELGFETRDAAHGKEALERLTHEALPDVVLVDWNMPEMDGLELIKTIRRDARYSGTMLLMVTTETETDQMLRALSAGADEYLMKPFTKESLIDKLQLIGVV
jgi:two-component system, chemotaxis family, chemotaxis protein CheY